MQEPLRVQKQNVQPMPQTGKVDIHAVREGLAMVMDSLRVMEQAGVKLSKAVILYDGKICLLPMIEIDGHGIGLTVTEGKQAFTVDGISVMEALEAGHGKE